MGVDGEGGQKGRGLSRWVSVPWFRGQKAGSVSQEFRETVFGSGAERRQQYFL